MKIKKGNKFNFYSFLIVIICFILSDVYSIINHTYETMDIVMDMLISLVMIRVMIVNFTEKK